jgi:DNA-binding HxlR family transcriptional regulator
VANEPAHDATAGVTDITCCPPGAKLYSCGLDAAVDVVGGKWKPMILWALSTRPHRFGELRREKVLIQQLRELQRDGIVDRQVHEQVPPKVVYSLTPLGESLDAALGPLGEWGEVNLAHIIAVRSSDQ